MHTCSAHTFIHSCVDTHTLTHTWPRRIFAGGGGGGGGLKTSLKARARRAVIKRT